MPKFVHGISARQSVKNLFLLGKLCDLVLYFVPNLSHFFQRFAFRIFQMPFDQLLLHLSNDRFRTRFFDGASHGHDKACLFNHFWCESLWMVVRDVDVALAHRLDYDWVDSLGWNGPGALRAQSMLVGEGFGHLASSRILNTNKQHGTLCQAWIALRI